MPQGRVFVHNEWRAFEINILAEIERGRHKLVPGPHSYLVEGTNRRQWIEALRTDPDAPPPSA
jgi:hypothetical protein